MGNASGRAGCSRDGHDRPVDPAFTPPYAVVVAELAEGPRLVGKPAGSRTGGAHARPPGRRRSSPCPTRSVSSVQARLTSSRMEPWSSRARGDPTHDRVVHVRGRSRRSTTSLPLSPSTGVLEVPRRRRRACGGETRSRVLRAVKRTSSRARRRDACSITFERVDRLVSESAARASCYFMV